MSEFLKGSRIKQSDVRTIVPPTPEPEDALVRRKQAANLIALWLDAGWTSERIAEQITADVWDRPSLETRAEFKAAILVYFAPLKQGMEWT